MALDVARRWASTRVGPRRSIERLSGYVPNIADPANGERVTRCRACGLPNTDVIVGTWRAMPVRFPVCQKCVEEVTGPLQPDPGQMSETAA